MRKNLKKWFHSIIARRPQADEAILKKRDCFVLLLRLRLAVGLAMTQILVLSLCLAISGCGPSWKRKFVRKRAPQEPDTVFTYQPQDYKREPNADLYQRHFVFWKAWQEELVERLGNNRMADIRAFEEALKNLDDMKDCLNDAKSAELDVYIKKLSGFFDSYKSGELDIVRSRQMRTDLDRLMLRIDKSFRFREVRDSIK